MTTSDAMKANGWVIDVGESNTISNRYEQKCGSSTFYGYKGGNSIGSVSATLRGNGLGTLNFGNCYTNGQVKVSLNGNELSRAEKNTPKQEIIFNYSKGDVLKIEEISTASLKLNSLTFKCTS